MPPDSDTSGRRPRVDDAAILDVLDESDDPVMSTAEIAEALPIKRRGTLNRLRRLEDAGEVESKRIGGRNTVWWLAQPAPADRRETSPPPASTDERREEPATDPLPKSAPETPPDAGTATAQALDDLDALVEDVGDEELPGSGSKLEERKAAFQAVVAYLREHGTATPAALRDGVYPDHPAQYTTGADPARSWWKNAMYPALKALAERTDAVRKADTAGEWEYVGPTGES